MEIKTLVQSSYKTRNWLEKIKKKISPNIGYRESQYYAIFTKNTIGICQLNVLKNSIRMFTVLPKDMSETLGIKLKDLTKSAFKCHYPTQFDIEDESDLENAAYLIDASYDIDRF